MLRLVKVVIEPAPVVVVIVEAVLLERPARVGIETVVPSILRLAAARTAAVAGHPLVVSRSEHTHGCPLSGADEGRVGNGVRRACAANG